jgi:predicted enzyme related to lactoylglutathione lyase
MAGHPIVHIEISAKDLKKAGEFYSELFGWTIQQLPEMNYATFDALEGPGGGFNPVNDENPAGTVLVYVGTDDIQDSLAKAEKLGGKTIVPKTVIPGMGWFAVFEDPTGNRIALYTNMEPQGQA